ncbi:MULTISPECIES: ABC transporter permease [Shigella]|uniref:ABC transporter permease subunit n=1 Tax=Shigella TaxID=620 RepID=UPI00086B16FE|nr:MULTISPECIES: ABC transporter permease [Shigella]ODG68440.1 hypothetical protein BFF42_08775 [Shigella sp. FC1661]ODJ24696.1 hypothetical protein BFR11_08890 [Shigella sp. FC2383]PHU71416.1 hypothetical protein CSW72_08945 [Shigella boydii]
MTFWSILRQRCWGLVLVVAGVCVITFIISHLIPGDPARLLAGDRAAMLEQLSEDYIRTARASGLPGWYIVLCYALPNALIPSITVLGLALGDLLYGAVLTETVFAWPGMGAWVVTSIQALDFPAVMGFAVVVSFAYVLVNLVVDLLYLWIDPRIGRGGGE